MLQPGKVAIIGHSYMALENRKQLGALGKHTEVLVLSPGTWHEGMSHFDFPTGTVEGDNWSIHFMREIRVPYLPQSQYMLKGLSKTLKDYSPDLIHIESDPWTLFAAQTIAARNRINRLIPIVCTAKQNTYTNRNALLDAAKQRIGRWGTGNTARFIAVSDLVPSIYARHFNVPAHRFDMNTHLGIDTDLFRPVADCNEKKSLVNKWVPQLGASAGFIVGYCGRLEEYKGLTDLIGAVRRAKAGNDMDIHLLVLGDGPLKNTLEDLSEKEPFIHLLSRVPHAEVAGFMQALDLFVMPARKDAGHEEHDAHAVMEAMSCGLPCVGTDSGAIPGVMAGTGTLVRSSDIEGLAGAIRLSVPQSSLRGKGTIPSNTSGRRRIKEHYSVEAVAEKNARTYVLALEEWIRRE